MVQKSAIIILFPVLLAACSHPLEIVGEGDILSSTGENDCFMEEQPCENIVTGDYVVTYTAVPREGHRFVRWEGCNSPSPSCSFNVPGEVVDQNWFEVMPPLRAVFETASAAVGEIDQVTGYVMGHSLWQHGSLDYHTGEWLARFAAFAGKTSTWGGRFGQLDQHAARLPINSFNEQDAALGYPSSTPVVDAWTPGTTWSSVGYDHLVTMPWNFAQASTPFDATPDPLSHVLAIVDFWNTDAPSARKMIFEHWPETSMVPGVPGSASLSNAQWRAFWEYTRGDYHSWFVGFQNEIHRARPGANIHMIPVGPVLADLFLDTAYMTGADSTDYFEDDAPHGLPSLYFLSALVWYRQIYGVSVDSAYPIPTTRPADIPPVIRNNFTSILSFIDSRLAYYNRNGVRVY